MQHRWRWLRACCSVLALGMAAATARAELQYLYGIHDHDPAPTEYLNHIKPQVGGGWITATVAVGHNPADYSGVNFSTFANQGHSVVCRINEGYCEVGTIPLPEYYANFAQRCANFVVNSPGCTIWVIGNETNLASEWPPRNGHKSYVSPQSYADCFRACYNAIKAVRPTHRVVCQAIAPFGGPYGPGTACGATHDGVPINWVQYLNQMLTAIKNSGGIDGIALHINSRGYTYNDIHSTQKVNANGQDLYFSFYVYKDWVDYGIPADLYHLPLYATECNGAYYWSGGFPENPASHYESGWMQEIYAEVNRYNQSAAASGKPIYRCVNMYRWCSWCDGWNIDGSTYKSQILADLDAAVSLRYTWPSTSYQHIVESRAGGLSFEDYLETGSLLNSRSKSTASGTTLGIGSRYGSLDRNGQGVKSGTYQFVPPMTGLYEVYATWPASSSAGTNVEHRVTHASGTTSAFKDQNSVSNPGGVNAWNSLGQFLLNAGTTYTVVPTNANYPQPGYIFWVDAVKWRYVDGGTIPPPVAAFIADRTSGNAPLAVQFTDQSTGSVLNWSWNFGDGQTSSVRHPAHTYAVPGTYTVSLTATGAGGSDTRTRTGYVTAAAVPGGQLLRNADFGDGLSGWTKWTQRDSAGNFTASVASGQLQCKGSNYNGGVYQQFSTGGAGRTVFLSGYWKSSPTIASSQWGEVIVINSARVPADGVDEMPGAQADDVLVFKNDTWASPAGWDGQMASTSPVAHVGSFVAAGDKATIIIKSGNTGAGMTGLITDQLYLRYRSTSADTDADGDVDGADYGVFAGCFNGTGNEVAAGCRDSDMNGDHSVDGIDFGLFAQCFNGSGNRPACQ